MARIKVSDQKGTVTIYVAGMMTVLILILNVVVVDIGRVFLNQEKATVAADAAAGAALGVAFNEARQQIFAGIQNKKAKIRSDFTQAQNSMNATRKNKLKELDNDLGEIKALLSADDSSQAQRQQDRSINYRQPKHLTDFLAEKKLEQSKIDKIEQVLKEIIALDMLREVTKNAQDIALGKLNEYKAVEDLKSEMVIDTLKRASAGKLQKGLGYDHFVEYPQQFWAGIVTKARLEARVYVEANDALLRDDKLFIDAGRLTAAVSASKSTYSKRLGQNAETVVERKRSF